MSKGNRKREAHAIKEAERLQREQFEANKRRVRKITAIIAGILIGCLVLFIVGGTVANNVRLNKGEYLRSEIAAASNKGTEVDGAMMNYFFNDTYNSFLNYYGSYVSYFGLNPSMSLKSQMSSETETWFDYLMGGAKDTVTKLLMLNEAAKADGIELTEAEIAAIRYRADNTDTGLYGIGTNKDDIFNAKLLEALAYKYQFHMQSELTPTEADVTAHYDDNAKNYQTVDYLSFPLYYVSADSDVKPGRDQSAIIEKDDVVEFADKLSAAASVDEFKAAVKEVLLAENHDMKEEDITAKLNALESVNATYTKDNEALEWAFTAAEGDTKVVIDEKNQTYTVYMMTKEANRNEADTISVRHVLLYDDTYKNRAGALAKAEELLAQFKAGDMGTDSFALLALEYSEDPGSYYNGGLYEGVTEGAMVENFDKWCFEDGRKAGDTGIVESEYGVHIMYFEDNGEAVWYETVSNDIVNEKLTKLEEEWKELYTVVFDENVIDSIPG